MFSNKSLLTFIFLIFLLYLNSYGQSYVDNPNKVPPNAQISKEELMKAINVKELQHPYIFFSNDAKT